MADIVIRGMEMPETCGDCPLSALRMDCKLTGRDISHDWIKRKIPDWCPLVFLPEGHGRLIDADGLQEEFKKSHDGKRLMLIDTAPTIVPAGGSNADV